MKRMNKYIRNRHHRNLLWKRVRVKSHPFETYMPYRYGGWAGDYKEQIEDHFKWIAEQARALDKGTHRRMFHAPKFYRKIINKHRKAKENMVMARIRRGEYDVELPQWKRDADWTYF